MRIVLEPTARTEVLNAVKFRMFEGHTDSGFGDLAAEFERAVCAVKPSDPTPVQLLSEHGLTRP